MTREAFEKLPKASQLMIEVIRRDAKKDYPPYNREREIAKGRGYLAGLKDAGVITENERKALVCYLTI